MGPSELSGQLLRSTLLAQCVKCIIPRFRKPHKTINRHLHARKRARGNTINAAADRVLAIKVINFEQTAATKERMFLGIRPG
jgi:hypothetical protein